MAHRGIAARKLRRQTGGRLAKLNGNAARDKLHQAALMVAVRKHLGYG